MGKRVAASLSPGREALNHIRRWNAAAAAMKDMTGRQ
jgi:hypothetical protein